MAQPTVFAGTKLLLKIGNGAIPEIFAEPCALTTKSFDLTASTNANLIPDCDDPEAPAWETTDVSSLSCSWSGSGLVTAESFKTYSAWLQSGENRNMQMWVGTLGHFAGAHKLTSLKVSGQRGNKLQIEIAGKADGAVTWVDAQP